MKLSLKLIGCIAFLFVGFAHAADLPSQEQLPEYPALYDYLEKCEKGQGDMFLDTLESIRTYPKMAGFFHYYLTTEETNLEMTQGFIQSCYNKGYFKLYLGISWGRVVATSVMCNWAIDPRISGEIVEAALGNFYLLRKIEPVGACGHEGGCTYEHDCDPDGDCDPVALDFDELIAELSAMSVG